MKKAKNILKTCTDPQYTANIEEGTVSFFVQMFFRLPISISLILYIRYDVILARTSNIAAQVMLSTAVVSTYSEITYHIFSGVSLYIFVFSFSPHSLV